MYPLSSLSQEEFRRENARRRQMRLKANVGPHDLLPLNKEPSINLLLVSRRSGMSDWHIRSRLFDINFRVSEGRLDALMAEERAGLIIDRWQAHEPSTEFLFIWRYGRPMVRPQHALCPSPKTLRLAAAAHLSDLDI